MSFVGAAPRAQNFNVDFDVGVHQGPHPHIHNTITSHFTIMASMFGFGRPQPSSAEKIAAAETEIEMVSDMFTRYVAPLYSRARLHDFFLYKNTQGLNSSILTRYYFYARVVWAEYALVLVQGVQSRATRASWPPS